MCFGGGSNAAEKEARRAREQEEARQAEIRQGRQNINAIFDGGFVADGPVQAPQSSRSSAPIRRTMSTRPDDPATMAFNEGPGGISQNPDGRQGGLLLGSITGFNRTARAPRASATPKGREVEGFATDDFFNRNRQSFMDYALPQLDQQFGDASKEMSFDLARSGLLNSSVRGEQGGKLQRLYDQNMQQVTNEALSREQQQRTSIEDARANLISMLQTTGDAQGATNQALSRAAVLSQPQPFSPMGQLFQDFTAGLGTQAAMERAEAVSNGRFQSRYDTGLFGAPSDAVMNRR